MALVLFLNLVDITNSVDYTTIDKCCIILDWIVTMGLATDYIFDRTHWRVEPIPDFVDFIRNLTLLVPEGSVLCLADGGWDSELNEFFARNEIPVPAGLSASRLADRRLTSWLNLLRNRS